MTKNLSLIFFPTIFIILKKKLAHLLFIFLLSFYFQIQILGSLNFHSFRTENTHTSLEKFPLNKNIFYFTLSLKKMVGIQVTKIFQFCDSDKTHEMVGARQDVILPHFVVFNIFYYCNFVTAIVRY